MLLCARRDTCAHGDAHDWVDSRRCPDPTCIRPGSIVPRCDGPHQAGPGVPPARESARCQHGGRARSHPHAPGLRGSRPAGGRPGRQLGRAVRPLVRRRRRRRAARAQRHGGGHRGRRRRPRRPHRADEGLRRGRHRLRHQLRLHQGRAAGGQPAGGAGLPLAPDAAAGARGRPGRAGGRRRLRRPVEPAPARRPAGGGGLRAVHRRRRAGGAGRAGPAARRGDRRGAGPAPAGLGRLPRRPRPGRVLAGRRRPLARPAALRPRRARGRLGRRAARPMKKDSAAPHTSQARRGPLQQGLPRRRAWAIDTEPLRNRAFRRLFGGIAATMLGQQMTLVAVPFQVFQLTGSSLLVGVTSVVALVPLIVFGLLGGAIADAMDRRRLMLITSAGSAGTSALLALQAALPGNGHLVVLWVLTAAVSGFAAVNQPTRGAVIPALVGPAGVPGANALSMTVRQVGVIVGPLLAGVLIGLGDLFLTYAVDALGFLLALLLLRGLPALPPGREAGPLRLRAAVQRVWEGFTFLRSQPVLLMTFVVDVCAMLFAWPQAVFPELSETRFTGSPNALGWLFAGVSIGALVMGLTSGWVSRVDRQGAVVLGAIAVWGLAIIGFGFAAALWVAVFCLAVAGAADMVSAVLRTSMLQLAAPEDMRGRMQGVFIVVVAGGPRLGDLRAGALASATSVTVAMVSGGVAVVLVMVLVALIVPSFWYFRASRSAQ